MRGQADRIIKIRPACSTYSGKRIVLYIQPLPLQNYFIGRDAVGRTYNENVQTLPLSGP